MTYTAPVEQIAFILNDVVLFPQLAKTGLFAEATPETVTAILPEPGRLAGGAIAR